MTSDKNIFLLDHVKDFTCEKKEDKEKKQKDILHISLQLKMKIWQSLPVIKKL